ncbi:MAG TPA: CheR family methyltransferase, partial [Thermomicrobiales bacterium]|nr:CheR family methyltransferase [Thermomicrobiales bacterium]
SPSIVDVMVNRERIGVLLTDFVNGGFAVPPASEHSLLRSFLEELREESGVDFTTYRQATIQRRVQRRMAATGEASLQDYVRLVRQHPEERRRLTSSFLINVTHFFRDPELFDYLRDQILSELMHEARNRGEDLRIWSAGCSTGEEAYSLSIMVSELLAEKEPGLNVRIFATDLDDEAVAFARRGFYSAHALSGLPPDMVSRYFIPHGDEYEVNKQLRGMLVFGEHDLAQRAPFPRIDLILCRNVLIYFTPALQRRALQLFAFSMRKGGFLVLGKSESVSPLTEHFAVDQSRLKVFRRVGDRTAIPTTRVRDVMPPAASQHVTPRPAAPQQLMPPTSSARAGSGEESLWNPERLLRVLPFGVVIVDRSYDIRDINGEARRLFGIHTTAMDQDLIHLVQEFDPIQLRRLIDQAMQSPEGSRGLLVSTRTHGETQQSVEVLCTALSGPGRERDGLIVVSAIDVTEREQIRHRRAAAEERSARLAKANEEVLASHQELTHLISRLRNENEQMLIASAEIQAATEEVETLNEELQASNEELETLNEELQATVEELNTTNDDLQARTLELQTLALRGRPRESSYAPSWTRSTTRSSWWTPAALSCSRTGCTAISLARAWDPQHSLMGRAPF